jgi:hypothetical protein
MARIAAPEEEPITQVHRMTRLVARTRATTLSTTSPSLQGQTTPSTELSRLFRTQGSGFLGLDVSRWPVRALGSVNGCRVSIQLTTRLSRYGHVDLLLTERCSGAVKVGTNSCLF